MLGVADQFDRAAGVCGCGESMDEGVDDRAEGPGGR